MSGLPAITADLNKLSYNIERIAALCHANGMTMAAVTKSVCAEQPIIELLNASGADYLADSRIKNLASMKTEKPRILIRIPMPQEAEDAVRHSELALISEKYTASLIAKAAREQKKPYKLVLMVDMGDLREGVFFHDEAAIMETAERIVNEDMLTLYGVGVNLTCFGGIMPDGTNLGGLVKLADMIRARFGIELPMVSGGNSSTMTMLNAGTVPEGITNLRIGEAYLLGNDTAAGEPMEGYYHNAFTVRAQIAELKTKPSKPIGTAGVNAFGEKVYFEDRGDMRRGILAIGRQDVEPGGLTPVDKRVEVLGASSDHMLVNLTGAPEYGLGDEIAFTPDYGALLKAYTSAYVEKRYV